MVEESAWKNRSMDIALNFVGAVAVICSLVGWLHNYHWFIDNFTAFRPQYLLVLSAVSVSQAVRKRYVFSALFSLIAIYNLVLVFPIYYPNAPTGNEATYKLMAFNVLTRNTGYGEVAEYVKEKDPDFLILQELNDEWWENMGGIREKYPYVEKRIRGDNFGIAFLSKYPIKTQVIENLSESGVPSIVAEIENQQLTIVATHPLPPLTGEYTQDRNQLLGNIAELCKSKEGNVILAGDLNTPPWSNYFEKLVRESGLRDSRQGFGIQLSWHAPIPLLDIPIDHVLVSKNIVVHNRETGPNLGSDHLPVLVEFSLK